MMMAITTFGGYEIPAAGQKQPTAPHVPGLRFDNFTSHIISCHNLTFDQEPG